MASKWFWQYTDLNKLNGLSTFATACLGRLLLPYITLESRPGDISQELWLVRLNMAEGPGFNNTSKENASLTQCNVCAKHTHNLAMLK